MSRPIEGLDSLGAVRTLRTSPGCANWGASVWRFGAKRHAQGRIVSCLEGGYNLGALARSAAAHVRVLAGV